MGRSSPTLDDLRNEHGVNQRNGASRPETFSYQNANYLGRQNYGDGTECVGSPNNSKCNGINERRKNREIYVRDISPLWNSDKNNNERNVVQEQPINSEIESGKYSDIAMVSQEYCPNRERIKNLRLSLGELCRVGAFTGNARTEEKPKTPCHFVVPNVQYKGQIFYEPMSHVSMGEKNDVTQKDCKIPKNPFLEVEMIANKLDHIKAYGFDHVILIGECYNGMLFLDCYGRLFEWGNMMAVLWPLGGKNYLLDPSRITFLTQSKYA
ncbi:hypothetical protein RhiirA1_452725 [Rhizophagus irregularis]|uniref:Uncharacterized protein n=1 Tax=Rhizophagus irregularis TaxID=588596 RepID=A0A2N0S969_9GLOM|nr:hypothetical protein RhiirA1_452725 [Rhizophagus irregularis]